MYKKNTTRFTIQQKIQRYSSFPREINKKNGKLGAVVSRQTRFFGAHKIEGSIPVGEKNLFSPGLEIFKYFF